MADLSKSGTPSLSNPDYDATPPGLVAGEALGAGDACYIKGSDGKIYKSLATTTATDETNKVFGFTPQAYAAGEACSLVYLTRFRYGSGMTPGTLFYLSGATAGALADASTSGQTKVLAAAIDATRIDVVRSF